MPPARRECGASSYFNNPRTARKLDAVLKDTCPYLYILYGNSKGNIPVCHRPPLFHLVVNIFRRAFHMRELIYIAYIYIPLRLFRFRKEKGISLNIMNEIKIWPRLICICILGPFLVDLIFMMSADESCREVANIKECLHWAMFINRE